MGKNSMNYELQLINTFRLDGRFRSVEDEYWDVKSMKKYDNSSGVQGIRRIFLQMHRVPFKISVEEVVEWFKPVVQVDSKHVFIHKGFSSKVEIYFSSVKEARKAMMKDGQYMLKRRINLFYHVDVLQSVRPKLIENQLQT